MIARALLAVPTVLVPLGPARDEPLEIAGVDASGFPTVVVDVVAPVRHTSEGITMGSVEVDGAAVESVSPVDPGDIVVGLVIDDRPEKSPAVVTGLQGAAVELVRNASDGIQVSLGTPSGLRTALTSDRRANIARIAGITAGAPAVIPLPYVLTETVAELASSPADDRHAVVVLGGAVELNAAQVTALTEVLAESGTTMHVLVPQDVRAGALARIAARTGGSTRRASAPLASMDRVTATISNRFRVTATVAGGGAHRVRLTAGGERFGAGFKVAPPTTAVYQASSEPIQEPAQGESAAAAPPTTAAAAETGAPLDLARPSGGGLPIRAIGLGVLALSVVALVAAGIVLIIRRWRDRDDDEPVVVKQPVANKVTTSKPPPAKTSVAPVKARAAPVKASVAPVKARAAPAKRAGVTPLPKRTTPRTPARAGAPAAATPMLHDSTTPPVEDDTYAAGWIVAGDVRVSPALGEVWCGDRRVELTPSELGILELLITSGGRGVTRDAIIAAGQLDASDGPDVVDAIVSQVRRKTGVRGRGNAVRKERVVTYFLEGAGADPER